jgi:hypothetical protein
MVKTQKRPFSALVQRMKARSLLSLSVLIVALASWSTFSAAQGPADPLPYGTFWNGSVETSYNSGIDPDGATTCCPTYSATSESTFVSHSLNGEGVTGFSIDESDPATVTIDGSAALEGEIDVSGNIFALAPANAGDGAISAGWFDTVDVVSSALPAGTPVNLQESLSLNFSDSLSSVSDASLQQVEVSWIPLNDEPGVPPFSIVADQTGCDCTQSQNLTQDSPVSLVVGGKYQVIVTVQLIFAGIPFANLEDGLALVSETSAFALASLSSDASFTTASGLGQACSNTYNGTFKGNLTVSSGTTCIIGGTVTGNVTQTGGTLYASVATIQKDLQISGGNFSIGSGTAINGNLQVHNVPASMVEDQVCGTNVKGNLQLQNNAAAIVIGGPNCAGDTVGGNIQVQKNAATTAISGDTAKGNIQVMDNGGMTSVTDNIAGGDIRVQNNADVTEVVDNSAANNLQCHGNDASMVGGPNTSGQIQGQCF